MQTYRAQIVVDPEAFGMDAVELTTRVSRWTRVRSRGS